jgi:threonine dehydrogenase-like Zn-dependent dehydrogenase
MRRSSCRWSDATLHRSALAHDPGRGKLQNRSDTPCALPSCAKLATSVSRTSPTPHYGPIDLSKAPFYQNVIVAGGPAPVRAYMDELLPDVMEGRIEPGRVFDRTVDLDAVPDGYRAMNEREALKVMVRP